MESLGPVGAAVHSVVLMVRNCILFHEQFDGHHNSFFNYIVLEWESFCSFNSKH